MLSLVIPVFNETGSLRQLHAEITTTVEPLAEPVETIFVDDGSRDGSWEVIKAIQAADPRVAAIRFRRNFGKAAALSAGFAAARGEIVFTLDADLQDDPHEIPRFLEKMAEGYDVVSGWKKVRHDPWHKTLPSKAFNWMVGWLTGVRLHDHNCGFKCYRREVFDAIDLYGEFHRFLPVLAEARGFRVGEIAVNHRPRLHGQSKYGWRRFARGFLDLLTVKFLTGFNHRPQHLLGGVGLLSFAVGAAGLAYLTVLWLCNYFGWGEFGPIGGRPLLIFSATLLLLGFQMISMGLVAELITARNLDRNQLYTVAERRPASAGRRTESSAANSAEALR
jgi:dolichol-phosphate mannosyltransferase